MKVAVILGVSLLLLVVLMASAFIVPESKQAFLTQFGKPIRDPITESGLHFRIPFVQKVRIFEKRFLEWDGDANQVQTSDKRYIAIDSYARWLISDALLFFQKVQNERGAQSKLDDILDGETRKVIARNNLVEMVRSQTRDVTNDSPEEERAEVATLSDFELGRNAIATEVMNAARIQLKDLGIDLLDLRFKRINYGADVQRKQFDRMISERNRIASRFRSEGEGEAAKILGERERQLKTIESAAFRQAEEIRGNADAKAITIYASAYNKGPESREFFKFLKTMESYSSSLRKQDWLVLSTKSDFYRYLTTLKGGAAP